MINDFEVISEKKNNVDSEINYDPNLIYESYICHICNINVPKMYQKEHTQTTKHKVYLEIADKSLERSRKQIKDEINHQKCDARYDCYFCQSCCSAVATELKGHHEKTSGHVISVQHDDSLKELLKYYLDRDNITIEFKLDKVKVLGNLNNVNNPVLNDNKKKKNKLIQIVDQTPNVVSNSSTVELEAIGDKVKNIIEDVANQGSNSNIAQSKANKSVTSKNNTEITVNVHEAQILIKDNTTNVEVNGTMVNSKINGAELEDANEKKTGSHEMRLKITKKKKKKKCNLNYRHYILCNELVKDAKTHICNNKNHKVNMKKALVSQNLSGKTHCDICEVDIDTHNFESHANGKTHCWNYEKKYPSFHNSNTVKNVVKKQNNNDLLSETNKLNEISCKVCKVQVLSKTMNQHLKGNIHVFKYNTLLYDNKLQTCANGYYCDVCKVNVHMDNLVDHVDSTEHVSSLNKLVALELNDYLQLVGLNKSHIYCRVCEVNVAYELPTIDEHVASGTHHNNFTELVEKNHLIKLGEQNGYHCILCNELLHGKVITHINSYEHKNAITKSKKETSLGNTIKIHPHMQTTVNDKQLKCKVCLILISSLSNSIEEHVKGKNHTKNYNKILEKFKKIGNKYFCILCNVFLKDHLIVDHSCENNRQETAEINSESTEVKMNRYKSMPDAKKICKVSIKSKEPGNASETQVPETSKKSVLHEHMDYTDTPNSLHCRVCKVRMSNNARCVDIHVNGLNHKNMYAILMKDNNLNERTNGFYCGFCDISLSKNFDIKHVFSEKHKMKMDATKASIKTTPVPVVFNQGEIIEQAGSKTKLNDKPSVMKYLLNSPSYLMIYKESVNKNRLVRRDDTYH